MSASTAGIARLIRSACLLEATARKPGNVHPEASFADLRYDDFVLAAHAAAPELAESRSRGVGRAILDAVSATARVTDGNVNLGIVLLIAPLAAIPSGVRLRDGIGGVLQGLTREDASLAYRAIRLAGAGGLGESKVDDVAGEPAGTLREVMELAADRDSVARQYADGFQLVLDTGVNMLAEEDDFSRNWERAIIGLHLNFMAACPDTLIARKRGLDEAHRSAALAQDVLDAGWPATRQGREKLLELDTWLRAEGNGRNPGTTADLVAASLFSALREGALPDPLETG